MWRFTIFVVLSVLYIHSDARPKNKENFLKSSSINYSRLSEEVKPTAYRIQLTVTEEGLNEKNEFEGTVAIDIQVQVDEPVTSFKIHAANLKIPDNSVVLKDNNNPGLTIDVTVEGPNEEDLLTITSSEALQKDIVYTLAIDYTGQLETFDMHGFYKSSYEENGTKKFLASTQFEQMGARKAFPCFDEPNFKATFQITITHPSYTSALSNTQEMSIVKEDDTKVTTFGITPKMSTYLVAFIVSEFECLEATTVGQKIDGILASEVCSSKQTEKQRNEALAVAPKSVDQLEEFTKFKYQDMNVGKLTQAAIPDFAAGAMENWGLITYREAALLWDDQETSSASKQVIVGDITHELAHFWFGDLVTLDWWSNIFLNEGFATFFGYHATEDKWDMKRQFVLEELQPVLISDADSSSKPLSYQTNDPDEIESRFNDISYNKGGSIFRMVYHFLGDGTFKDGLAKYIDKKKFDSGTVESLWESFQEVVQEDVVPDKVGKVMENWTYKAGYPVLNVTESEEGNITITQQRFLLSGTDEAKTKWYVPISYAIRSTKNFANTKPQNWLSPAEDLKITIPKDDWIILNNQQVGYYRVNYDSNLLKKIQSDLNEAINNIEEISRSHLIDDQLNLARAGFKSYEEVLRFLPFLKGDSSYFAWSSAFNGLNYVFRRIANPKIKDGLQKEVVSWMESLLKSVPIDSKATTQIDILKKTLAHTWACNFKDSNCIQVAKTSFDNYRKTHTRPSDPNLRSIVYCNGLRESEQPSDDFDFMFQEYKSSIIPTEQFTIIKALGCVKTSEQRIKYLEMALTDEIRIQDARFVFASVYSNNPEGVDDVLTFIQKNGSQFNAHFNSDSPLISLISAVSDLITSQEQIDKLTAFLQSKGLSDDIKAGGDAAVNRAKNNLKTIEDIQKQLSFLSNSAAIFSFSFINLALFFVLFLLN